jgi:hypothetical protein
MAGKQITELQLRKKALLLESNLNRLRLRAEIAQLHEATEWVKNLHGLRQRLRPWAVALAPLAGVAAALGLRRSSTGGLLQKTLVIAPALIRLWRTFAKPSDESK